MPPSPDSPLLGSGDRPKSDAAKPTPIRIPPGFEPVIRPAAAGPPTERDATAPDNPPDGAPGASDGPTSSSPDSSSDESGRPSEAKVRAWTARGRPAGLRGEKNGSHEDGMRSEGWGGQPRPSGGGGMAAPHDDANARATAASTSRGLSAAFSLPESGALSTVGASGVVSIVNARLGRSTSSASRSRPVPLGPRGRPAVSPAPSPRPPPKAGAAPSQLILLLSAELFCPAHWEVVFLATKRLDVQCCRADDLVSQLTVSSAPGRVLLIPARCCALSSTAPWWQRGAWGAADRPAAASSAAAAPFGPRRRVAPPTGAAKLSRQRLRVGEIVRLEEDRWPARSPTPDPDQKPGPPPVFSVGRA